MSAPVVIFDLDDTLYAERDYALSGFRAAGRWARDALGVVGLEAEMARRREVPKIGPNDNVIGCPLCNVGPKPGYVPAPPATTSTSGG